MDEDRYYNLGSHDKLFNQIDELTDALASRDAEIESLRQQIDNLAVDITLLRRQVSALEKQDGELESMRQQLAAAKATIKAKDDYLMWLSGYTSESTVASLIVQKALAATELHDRS